MVRTFGLVWLENRDVWQTTGKFRKLSHRNSMQHISCTKSCDQVPKRIEETFAQDTMTIEKCQSVASY